jgi:tRNA(Ile)-lysidine synthase TilS/MesJ
MSKAEENHYDPQARRKEAERSIIKLYRKELWSRFTQAVNKYELIKPGDKIAVCVSGGKDSFLMAKLFQELFEHGERNFEVIYLNMDPGYNEKNRSKIIDNAQLLGVPLINFRSSIFDIVGEDDTSPCYPCARMRRGALYAHAKDLSCNKIALGHHYDDVIETILMGMLYGGQFQTMMPKLHSVNFPGMELIRPMYLIREENIIRWAKHNELEFIACACRLTEGLSSGKDSISSKRAEIKSLIKELHEVNPYTEANIFKSVENVNLSTIIRYKKDGRAHHFLDEYDTNKDLSEFP